MPEQDDNKPPFDFSNIDRRDFLRFLSGGTLFLASGSILAGCGGGGGGSSSGSNGGGGTLGPLGTSLFSQSKQSTSSGTKITDIARKITLFVPANTTPASTKVSLDVYTSQRAAAAASGFTINPNAANVSIDPAAMAAKSAIQITIPLAGTYDALGSMMLVTDDQGNYLTLDVSYDATSNLLTGSVTKEQLQALAMSVQAQGYSLHPLPNITLPSFGIFTGTLARVLPIPYGNFYRYNASTYNFDLLSSGSKMPTKRIALVLHGIFDNQTDMLPLAQFLMDGISSGISPGTYSIYSEVWAYSFNWKAPIADNSKLFAQKLNATLSSGTIVDIYAHSTGGLVSRYALEKQGLGSKVKRLVTLGTPHEGVPALLVQLLVWFIALKTGGNIADWLPGMNDLAAPAVENPLSPSFIYQLNRNSSPYEKTDEYFTLAGTNHNLTYTILGHDVDLGAGFSAYLNSLNLVDPGFLAQSDGIVPEYSALNSPVLNNKSDKWAHDQIHHTEHLDLTHEELKSVLTASGPFGKTVDQDVITVLKKWIIGTGGITVS